MSDSPPIPPGESRGTAFRRARFAQEDNTLVMLLPPSPLTVGPQSMVPKQLSHSSVQKMVTLSEMFYQKHKRCLAFLLLFNGEGWGYALPLQRCSDDSSCWEAAREHFPDFGEEWLLAGSFQSRVIAEAELADAVPPTDGLHIVCQILPQLSLIWRFLTCRRKNSSTGHQE